MKRLLFVFALIFGLNLMADGGFYRLDKLASDQNYPIKPHHERVGLECKSCHSAIDKENGKISRVGSSACNECHVGYSALAKRSAHLGYDDNIHASPHYPDMSCTTCHASHKPSTNYCVMCHSQESMKNLIVP